MFKPNCFFKVLASTAFVVFVVWRGALQTHYGQAILAAMIFSWIGDILLISLSRRVFLAGIGSFLVAHLWFAAAFLVRGIDLHATLGAGVVLLIIAVVVSRWLLPHVTRTSPTMKIPVVAYMVAISVMVALAGGTAVASANPWIGIGAVLFFVSDLSVARDRFVAPGFINKAWGLPVYYIAQFILAASV